MAFIKNTTHLSEVCKAGQGAVSCKYLSSSGKFFSCEKHTESGKTIEKLSDRFVAQGDNCEGLKK